MAFFFLSPADKFLAEEDRFVLELNRFGQTETSVE